MKIIHKPLTSCILRTCSSRSYSSCLYSLNRFNLTTESRTVYPIASATPNLRTSVQIRFRSDKSNLSDIIVPVAIKAASNPDDINVGEELTGTKLRPEDVQTALNQFYRRPPVKTLSSEHGMDPALFQKAFASFKSYCLESTILEPEIHIILDEVIRGFR